MLKYAKVENETTGLCTVGIGDDDEYYQSIGMTMQDVEISDVDGSWYLASMCPHLTPEQEAEERQAQFEREFFNVQGYGWYRRVPKGYSSAVESMNTLFNVANIAQGIQAGLIIFYPTPDFTIAEQCTEEWLVAHQIIMPAMTLQEFMQLYVVFMTAWNTQEHVNLEE